MKNIMKRPLQSPQKRFLLRGYEEHNEEAGSDSKKDSYSGVMKNIMKRPLQSPQKRFLLRGYEEHNEEAASVPPKKIPIEGL